MKDERTYVDLEAMQRGKRVGSVWSGNLGLAGVSEHEINFLDISMSGNLLGFTIVLVVTRPLSFKLII